MALIKDVEVGSRWVLRLTTGRFVVVRVLAVLEPGRWSAGRPRRLSLQQEDSGRVFSGTAAKLRFPGPPKGGGQ